MHRINDEKWASSRIVTVIVLVGSHVELTMFKRGFGWLARVSGMASVECLGGLGGLEGLQMLVVRLV